MLTSLYNVNSIDLYIIYLIFKLDSNSMQMEFYLSFASILENEYYWWYEYISLKKEYTSILEKIHKNLLCSKQDQFPRNKCKFHKSQQMNY